MRPAGRASLLLTFLAACSDGASSLANPDASIPDSGGEGPPADAGADAGSPDASTVGTRVETSAGPIEGSSDGDLRVFLGIPFAEPPVGDLRFKAPVPERAWTSTRSTKEYGPSCPQVALGPELLLGGFAGPTSEDCLTLNVFAHGDSKKRPVMVFIFGGGFVVGGSAWPVYDARRLARRADVVVVTINYRLGAFGFLATRALVDESPDGSAGNYGLLDQIAALRFVRENAEVFGGDPDSVTVFGESAGAFSICALLASPLAVTAFDRAILESGAGCHSFPRLLEPGVFNAPAAVDLGKELVDHVGCGEADDELLCLRALSVEDLTNEAALGPLLEGDFKKVMAFSPKIDGVVVPDSPFEAIAAGTTDRPIIVGSNANEGALFAAATIIPTRISLRAKAEELVGPGLVDAVLDVYPLSDFLIAHDAYAAMLGDFLFTCPTLSLARAASQGEPAFVYHFTRAPLLARITTGAIHGLELPYVFGTFEAMALIPTTLDLRVSETIQRAFGGFAHGENPPLSIEWPAFSPDTHQIARIDEPPELLDDVANGRCAKLAELGLVP
ncbi:MAG: carboxylesterase family protein [Deltaproteobacteria bacterium]|nr:carboxylesterase family protein [Deltaproteobacteria bacterium]